MISAKDASLRHYQLVHVPGDSLTMANLHIGTLSRYAAALGGRLELRITFPDGTSVDIAESSEDAA